MSVLSRTQVALCTGRVPQWLWTLVESAPEALPRSLRMFWFRCCVFGPSRTLHELQESETEASAILRALAERSQPPASMSVPESVAAARVLSRRTTSGTLGYVGVACMCVVAHSTVCRSTPSYWPSLYFSTSV